MYYLPRPGRFWLLSIFWSSSYICLWKGERLLTVAASPYEPGTLQGGAKSAINRRGKSKESRRTGAGGGHEDEDDGGTSA